MGIEVAAYAIAAALLTWMDWSLYAASRRAEKCARRLTSEVVLLEICLGLLTVAVVVLWACVCARMLL